MRNAWLVSAYVDHKYVSGPMIVHGSRIKCIHLLHFYFSAKILFLSLTSGLHLSARLLKVPSLHPILFKGSVKLPQLCVPQYISSTSFIFIKLILLRFFKYYISKFMVFYIEFNHEFYFMESPFYFWDFKALSSF